MDVEQFIAQKKAAKIYPCIVCDTGKAPEVRRAHNAGVAGGPALAIWMSEDQSIPCTANQMNRHLSQHRDSEPTA